MRYHEAIYFARSWRKNMISSEKIFREKVRTRRFLRQNKIEHSNARNYFIWFYCHELRLIVEVDGSIHKKQIEYDLERERIRKEMKYHVYRIKNEEVLTSLVNQILSNIASN